MTTTIEQLWQLRKVTWDGDLISKTDRDCLVAEGYATTVRGYNFLTPAGVTLMAVLGLFASRLDN